MPPLLANFIHAMGCKPICEKSLTLPADVLIAVWDGSPSGTGKTVRYAHQQGKSVITINPRTLCIEQQ